MYILEKLGDLKDWFRRFRICKKKFQALKNYSEAAPFHHREHLALIEKCLYKNDTGEEVANFLSYLVDQYEINYLSWSHRTQSLKKKMVAVRQEKHKMYGMQPFLFDMPTNEKGYNRGIV